MNIKDVIGMDESLFRPIAASIIRDWLNNHKMSRDDTALVLDDINPHLNIEKLCDTLRVVVENETGKRPDTQFVMLVWLSEFYMQSIKMQYHNGASEIKSLPKSV